MIYFNFRSSPNNEKGQEQGTEISQKSRFLVGYTKALLQAGVGVGGYTSVTLTVSGYASFLRV